MHKLVRRVTVVKVSGENREAKVVYEGEHEDDENEPSMESFERGVRRLLKADLIRAQEAYDRHVKSASRSGKGEWLFDVPSNIVKSILKAERDTREGAKGEHEKEEAKREGEKAGD
jgi:hypothetical protein